MTITAPPAINFGYVSGVQPTINYPGPLQAGDIVVIYMAANRGFGIQDMLGVPLQTIDAEQMGTLCDALYIRVIDGSESTLQVYSFADVPSQDKFFAVNGPFILMTFRGARSSQADGYSNVQSPSAHIMQFPDAISTAANDAVLLLGCCSSVLAALDTDAVAGYTHLGTARDASRGVNCFWKIQAGAGHTGVPNGSQSVGTNLICHTLCLFEQPAPPPSGGGGPPPTTTRAKSKLVFT